MSKIYSSSENLSEYPYEKRKRTRISRFQFDDVDPEEQRMLQQALRNSIKDTKVQDQHVPDAPVYYPTLEQFKDPLGYIKSIAPEARNYGICKIVPPPEWNPTFQVDFQCPLKFSTKHQAIHSLQEGVDFDDGPQYDISSYRTMSDNFKKDWSDKHYNSKPMSHDSLERDYWLMVETASKEAEVDYGNDIDILSYQSGFPQTGNFTDGVEEKECKDMFSDEYYKRSGWNLRNIASSRGSLLKHLTTNVNGVNVPWLYVGMLFSTFCWHNEDNYLYSISYSHYGDVKQWYGVPGDEAHQFEKVLKDNLMATFQETPDLLYHITTQISPSVLMANGVHVYQAKHTPGTFMMTFPKSYHGGFSYGFNVGEAVNFALDDWVIAGGKNSLVGFRFRDLVMIVGEAEERYRLYSRPSVFSHHRLLLTLLHHAGELDQRSKKDLRLELLKVVNEEIQSRKNLFEQGIRDVSDKLPLPSISYDCIDEKACEYDEMRCCSQCNYVCVLSAIACECNHTKVCCPRHVSQFCKCPMDKKYLLMWMTTKNLLQLQHSLTDNATV